MDSIYFEVGLCIVLTIISIINIKDIIKMNKIIKRTRYEMYKMRIKRGYKKWY